MDRFYLETDESLEERCGEVYRTTKGRITFYCTLCQEEAFFDFKSYMVHINQEHLFAEIDIKIDNLYVEEKEVLIESSEIHLPIESNDLKKYPFESEILIESSEIHLPIESNDLKNDPIESELLAEKKPGNDTEKQSNILKKKKITNYSETKILNKFDTKEKTQQDALCNGLPQTSNSETNSPSKLKIPTEIRKVNKRVLHKTPSRSRSFADEERTHKCSICDMRFINKWNLAYHFKRHTNERNFSCSECDKKFFTSAELKSHIAHIHTKKRPLLCTECGRTFYSKSTLGAHIKRHKNQRDFVCTICKKAFFDSAELKLHVFLHSSERSFSCNFCDAAFKQPAGLRNHLKLHKNKREYKCELCETKFNQKAALISHMRTSHKVV